MHKNSRLTGSFIIVMVFLSIAVICTSAATLIPGPVGPTPSPNSYNLQAAQIDAQVQINGLEKVMTQYNQPLSCPNGFDCTRISKKNHYGLINKVVVS